MEKKIVLFAVALVAIHLIAIFYNLYWRFLWMDIPMHFLGGVLVAVVFIWFFERFPGHIDLSRNFLLTIILTLGFVALIGVLWEFNEFVYDLLISSRGWGVLTSQGTSDMVGDLFFDILGGLCVVIFKRLRYNKH